jgi:hypothetical protein
MPAPLFATVAPVPQRTRRLYEQARSGVEIAGLAPHHRLVMGFHGPYEPGAVPGPEPVGIRDEANGREGRGATGSVHSAQHQPPGSQAVRAPLREANQALIRAAAHPIGHPLLEGAFIRGGPAAVVFEPEVRGPDCICRAVGHVADDSHWTWDAAAEAVPSALEWFSFVCLSATRLSGIVMRERAIHHEEPI